jgi:hypothetical protein
MSAVTNLWRQLVQRRLWPVAIVLVAALAAVPLMLAKDPEVQPPPPAPQVDTNSELATAPIVTAATAEDRANRRKVLGAAKNPFGAPAKPKTSSAPTGNRSVVQTSPTGGNKPDDTSSSTGDGGGSTAPSTGTTAPAAPAAPVTPAEPEPKPKTYAPQELTVRFGGDESKRQSLKRLQALPSEESPALIYMGLLKDGKTAEFMVGDGVVPVGDGECRPSPEECEIVRLRAGETEFFDITDETGAVTEQFQLDLIKIHRGGGASASKSRAKASVKAATRLLHGDAGLRSTVGQSTARLP